MAIDCGQTAKLDIEDRILLTLEYWREYRTQFRLAKSWNLSESSVCRIIARVEEILTDCKEFELPTKRFRDLPLEVAVVIVDAAETEVERPKKTTPLLFGQEAAAHDKNANSSLPSNGRILDVRFAKGARHDYSLYKHSKV